MDFFERQEQARRRTTLLVFAFVIALALIVVAVDAVVWGVLYTLEQVPADPRAWLAMPQSWALTALVAAAILGTSLVRGIQLARGGGGRVAQLMGGRLVDPDTREPAEAVLINVVEEMAIASGMTVPDVYVLDREPSLNAFAAGLHPANAVVAVTRGTLEGLDRDALQGVIAHEFSHILNGDMRLNLRLLALLAGITVIGELGATPWRSLALSRGSVHGRSRRTPGVLLLAGLALMVIGWFGVFAGRLIKAAVSRQRECLADAAAVQFTRNPDGLAHALLAIHAHQGTSLLSAAHAEEISHMGFGRTVGGLVGLTATHPSIEERLVALGPKYELWYRQAERARRRRKREGRYTPDACRSRAEPGAQADPSVVPVPAAADGTCAIEGSLGTLLSGAALAALAGRTAPTAIDHAHALLQRLPAELRRAVHQPEGAADAVHALLLHDPLPETGPTECGQRTRDLVALPEARHEAILRLRDALEGTCPGTAPGTLDAAVRLPVLELTLPALRRLGETERAAFLQRVDALIRSDGRLSIFEYAARTILRRGLDRQVGDGTAAVSARRTEAATVISTLAHIGHPDPADRQAAFERAMTPLYGADSGTLMPVEDCDLRTFSRALQELDDLHPLAKRALLTACGDCIAADGRIRPAEAEMLRAIAAGLAAPIPPLAALAADTPA